jgi:hypothetical protein
MKPEPEPDYCINCGKKQTAEDVVVIDNHKILKCLKQGNKGCDSLLNTEPTVRCLGGGDNGCKGENLFLLPHNSNLDLKKIKCPLCEEVGFFAIVKLK